MAQRPKRYRFEACDSEDEPTVMEADSLTVGQELAAFTGCTVIVRERTDIRDGTPKGDGKGLLWDYDEEFHSEIDP